MDTVPALLRSAARRWGDKTALMSAKEAPASFAKLDRFADRFAAASVADGMLAGERVALWAPNRWEWVAAAVGIQRAGGVLVPIGGRLRAVEVDDILRRGDVERIVLAQHSRGLSLAQMLTCVDLPEMRRVVVLPPDAAPNAGAVMGWNAFLALADQADLALLRAREAAIHGDTCSDILFTSGTTGRPKGAVFRHRSTVLSGHGMINFARVGEADCLCPLGPFAHFAGYKAGWVNGLITGATVCWVDDYSSESLLNAIAGMKITVMPAPPVVWSDILNHPHRQDWDLSNLRFIATGSTVIPPALVRSLMAELNVEQVGTGYGLTESGGNTNFSRRDDAVEDVVNTAGRPAPDAEVRIVDREGRQLEPGEPGEIAVRSERTMREYLDDAEATAAALTDDGWLHTGDIGMIDSRGYLRVTDRLKDMYITNGFNVYPAEVERLLSSVPGIAECALVGQPHPRKGEVGHAFIVRAPGSDLGVEAVLAWCRDNVAGYKVPSEVSFVETLPRNAQGKVLKTELKAKLG